MSKSKPASPPVAPSQKRRKRNASKSKESSFESRAWSLLRDLRKLLEDISEENGQAFPVSDEKETIPFEMMIPLHPRVSKDIYDEATRQVVDGLRTLSQERDTDQPISIPTGRIHCFQCRSLGCDHSRPQSLQDVFQGYSATGKPMWETLTNLCIRLGDPRVDLLYKGNNSVIAMMWSSRDLNQDLLAGFGQGNRAYTLRGQVAAGHLHFPQTIEKKGEERRVIAFQIIECLEESGRNALRFNLTGATMFELAEAAHISRSAYGSLYHRARDTQDRIAGLSRRWDDAQRRGEVFDTEGRCEGLMRSLRTDLERIFRATGRRTLHAQEHHERGVRPTSHAHKDLRNASAESTFRDTTKGTLIVVGGKGRIHVFSGAGKLVTSLLFGKSDVEKRLLDGRWSPVSRSQFDDWKENALRLKSDAGNPSKKEGA